MNNQDWKFDFEYPKRTRYGYDIWISWTCKHCGRSKSRAGTEPPKRKCECQKEKLNA